MTNLFNEGVIIPIVEAIKRHADRPALCVNGSFYTYKQFGESVSKIRSYIRQSIKDQFPIGVVDNADLETYASILAIWLEGKCYVPLQPTWPVERNQVIISHSKMRLCFDTSPKSRYNVEQIINPHNIEKAEEMLQVEDFSDDCLACVLFTSGSTGHPKGVRISRKGLGTAIQSFWKTGVTLTCSDRCLQSFDLSFVVSFQCIYAPLQRGACLFPIPTGEIKYAYIIKLIDEHHLTFCQMVLSMLILIQPYMVKSHCEQIHTFIILGEPCPIDVMKVLLDQLPHTRIIQYYGSTETTLHTFCYCPTKKNLVTHNGFLTIGTIIPPNRVLILGDDKEPVQLGEKGELCIGGDQVSPGYWDDNEQNSSSFFYRLIDGKRFRFFYTGDLCFQNTDGYVLICGRINSMVKIQGNRIELMEIENVARRYLNNINVVCLPVKREDHLTEISLFIESVEFPIEDMRKYLYTKLPSYMVPHRIKFIRHFPHNSNGKIDRYALISFC